MKMYTCRDKKCGRTFLTSALLSDHIAQQHQSRVFGSRKPKQQYGCKSSYQGDVNGALVSCKCGKSYISQQAKDDHIKRDHGGTEPEQQQTPWQDLPPPATVAEARARGLV